MGNIITTILLVLILLSLVIFFIVLSNSSKIGKNKVHFYVARDKNGELYLWFRKPYRSIKRWVNIDHSLIVACSFEFNYYGLNYKYYDNLKWEDEPVEVFLNLED